MLLHPALGEERTDLTNTTVRNNLYANEPGEAWFRYDYTAHRSFTSCNIKLGHPVGAGILCTIVIPLPWWSCNYTFESNCTWSRKGNLSYLQNPELSARLHQLVGEMMHLRWRQTTSTHASYWSSCIYYRVVRTPLFYLYSLETNIKSSWKISFCKFITSIKISSTVQLCLVYNTVSIVILIHFCPSISLLILVYYLVSIPS